MTTINDIVLIYFEGDPLFFARVEGITPDVKAGWYQVKLLILQVPLQVVTWILRDVYISGDEFTMSGKRMRLEKVVCPEDDEASKALEKNNRKVEKTPAKDKDKSSAKVISLADIKKK